MDNYGRHVERVGELHFRGGAPLAAEAPDARASPVCRAKRDFSIIACMPVSEHLSAQRFRHGQQTDR